MNFKLTLFYVLLFEKVMGQSVSNQLETFKDDVVKEAHSIKEIIDISHEEFLEKIKEVNSMYTYVNYVSLT